MAESGLTLTLDDLRDAVTEFVYGGDGDYTNLTSAEQNRVDRVVNSGLRRFYSPPAIGGRSHQWSFLQPYTVIQLNAPYEEGTIEVSSGVVTLTGGTFPSWAAKGVLEVEGSDYTVASRDSDTQLTLDNTSLDVSSGTSYSLHQDDYDLPDDFGYALENITFDQSDNAWYVAREVSSERIKELRQRDYAQNFSSGEPQLYATEPIPNDDDLTVGYRQRIMFWPAVTSAARAHLRYRVRPDSLTTAGNYPWGASDHSETILQACYATAEQVVDEERGVYWQTFMELLTSSIEIDRRDNRPRFLGYNSDLSDSRGFMGDRLDLDHWLGAGNGVTYKGAGGL